MLDRKTDNELEIEPEPTDAFEDMELEDAETSTGNKLKDVRDKLKQCEAEKMSHLEELQRAKADFLNARRRLEEERERDKERARIRFIEELLPLCDSFHMAMGNQEAWNNVDEVWRKGVESIYSQLEQILTAHHVSKVDPLGEAFDPTLHDAMSNQPVTDEAQHHTIIQVIQPGYSMKVGDTTDVIRPARVIVGEFTNTD